MPDAASVDARRPLIVIPARFSPRATALRYEAEVTARALVAAVFAAGGEPVVIHPYAPSRKIDVDAARAELEAKGVVFDGDTITTGVCKQAWFKDPDGNALMLHRRFDV